MAIRKVIKHVLFSTLAAASVAAIAVAGFQFEVGDGMGWKKPTGNEPKTYNEWASQNRFRIGDTVHFKYERDSVLLVTSADYVTCNGTNPIAKFEDGSTVFRFGRARLFYFISGEPGHCKSGQRFIIRVLHPFHVAAPPELEASPSPAGGPGGDSGESGSPHVSSTSRPAVVSCFVKAIAGLIFGLYLFI